MVDREYDDRDLMLLIDDLMYLRSMRREVYVCARDCNIPLLTVWVKTDLHLALERNSKRVECLSIPNDVIEKIDANLQPPDPSFIFDRHSIVVDGNAPLER